VTLIFIHKFDSFLISEILVTESMQIL
jgi:hypothetical protein